MDDDTLLDFLQKEAHQHDANMRGLMSQAFGYGALGFTTLGAAATLIGSAKQYGALLALPLIGEIIWFLCLRALAELFAISAHRQHCETQIAKLLASGGYGDAYVPWGAAGGRISRRSPVNVAVFASFVVMEIAVALACFAICWSKLHRAHGLVIADIALWGIGAGIAILLAVEVVGTAKTTDEAIQLAPVA